MSCKFILKDLGEYMVQERKGKWRRGRDSNPRCRCRHTGFQDRRIQPLCHPSVRVFKFSRGRPLSLCCGQRH